MPSSAYPPVKIPGMLPTIDSRANHSAPWLARHLHQPMPRQAGRQFYVCARTFQFTEQPAKSRGIDEEVERHGLFDKPLARA